MSDTLKNATRDELKSLVLQQLISVAPDIEAEDIEPKTNFRDQFDFDSMDHLHFVVALHKQTGIDIPEIDYPKLLNLDACIDYLQARFS